MRARVGFSLSLVVVGALALAACTPPPAPRRLALTGQDGDKTVSGTEIVNRYTPLTVAATAGASSLTVADVTGFAAGDLVLIVAAQGATIDTTDGPSYGTITALGAAGQHEWWLLAGIDSGTNVLSLAPGCGASGLANAYPLAAHPQVVRVPQYANLTVPAGATLTGKTWDGQSGGFVVVYVEGTAAIDGLVSANGLGLRAGALAAGTGTLGDDVTTYRAATPVGGAKGESLAGDALAYDALGGRYGRGAPANGGGGGNGYLAGGGGGAGLDATSMTPYSGEGVMSSAVIGGAAWAFDPGQASQGGPGGGRGGYTLSAVDRDALSIAPGDAQWGGNARRERGGLGGHPPTARRIFLGGGGGAGHFDGVAPTPSSAGNGGGVVYLSASTIGGAGSISADGLAGRAGQLVGTNDPVSIANGGGAGGGGGGGTVVLRGGGNAALVVSARGGRGGDLALSGSFAPNVAAASGAGGGGGGGAVALGTGLSLAVTPDVSAALGGTTSAPALAEFPSNGASGGHAGTNFTGLSPTAAPVACLPANLALTLTDSADPVDAGAGFSYTATVQNLGPNAANDLSLVLTLPAAVSAGAIAAPGWSCSLSGVTLTCTLALLRSAQTATVSIAVTAPTSPTTLNASATITSREDPTLGNNTEGESTVVQLSQADLALTSTAPMRAAAGEPFTYSLLVTNQGPRDAPSLQVVDTLPAGTSLVSATGTGWTCTPGSGSVTCAHGPLSTGQSAGIDLVLDAPAVTSPTDVSHSAKVSLTSSGAADPNTSNDIASSTTSIRPVDLAIAKLDLVDPVAVGATLGYVLTVSNAATVAAHEVVVNDTLPSGSSFLSASGEGWACAFSGGAVSCTRAVIEAAPALTPSITLYVAAPASPGVIANTATVSSSATDPTLANNTSTQQTTVAAAGTGSADLRIAVEHTPEPVRIGAPIDYTIRVSNQGADPASSVQVAAVIPTGASFVSATGTGWTCAAANGVVSCQAAAALPVGPAAPIALHLTAPSTPGTIDLPAMVTATTPDPMLADDATVASATVIDPTSSNQPPTITLPPSLSTPEDTALVLAGEAAPKIDDPDAGDDEVELLVSGTGGVLSLSGSFGLTLLEGDGVLDPVLRARGSLVALNAALAGSTFTPEPNVFGPASLRFRVDDLGHNGAGGPQQAEAVLTIAITPVDDPPVAVDDEVSAPGDQTSTIDVLANDRSGEPEQPLTITAAGPAMYGLVTVGDGTLAYTPPKGFYGDDRFTYTISDGTSTATGTVLVHVGDPASGPAQPKLGGGGLGCSAAPGRAPGLPAGLLALALALYARTSRRRKQSYCSRSASKTGVGA